MNESGNPDPHPATDNTDGSEPDPMPLSEETVTERWWDYLHGYSTCRWKRFFPDDPPEPAKPVLPHRPGPGHVVPFKKKRE